MKKITVPADYADMMKDAYRNYGVKVTEQVDGGSFEVIGDLFVLVEMVNDITLGDEENSKDILDTLEDA